MGRDQPADTADRVADVTFQPPSPFARPLSRRRLLQGAGALAAAMVLGESCAPSTPSLLPARTVAPTPSAATPSPSPTPLGADQLTTAAAALPSSGAMPLPGGASAEATDLIAAAAAFAVADPQAARIDRNPIAALGLALAVADWSGQQGAIDLTGVFPKLPLTPVRLVLPSLPGGKPADTLTPATPPGLTLRPGCALLLAGTLPDGRIVLGVADPGRKVAGHPRLELAFLSAATLTPLLALAGASLDTAGTAVTLAGGSPVPLAMIDPVLGTRLVTGAGVLFVDEVPLQPKGAKTPLLTVDPYVPALPASLAPAGSRITQLKDGRIVALDATGKAIARAANLGGDWQWVGPDKAAGLDYFLRELADGLGIRIGVAPDGAQFNANNTAYLALIGKYFNLDSNDIGGWRDRNPAPGQFNFGWGDMIVSFAPAHHMRALGYLVGTPPGVPTWALAGSYSARQMAAFTKEWVTTVASRYAGDIGTWIVFNEPVSATLYGATPAEHFWANTFGSDFWPFIAQTFAWARAADPHASLILNDQANDGRTDTTSAGFYQLVQYLLAQKAPLDGVAMEMHLAYHDASISGQWSPEIFTSWVKRYRALGLQVYVTEFDVDMTGFPGTKAEEEAWQASYYRDYLQAALDAGITNFTIFGLTDTTSWYNLTGRPHADALMLNGDYSPKPAYFAVRDVLKKRAGLA